MDGSGKLGDVDDMMFSGMGREPQWSMDGSGHGQSWNNGMGGMAWNQMDGSGHGQSWNMDGSGHGQSWNMDGSGHGQPWSNGMGGMGMNPISGVMAPVVRLQMLFGMIGSHVLRADYPSLRLPGCFPEEFNDNFRRFVKAVVMRRNPPVQQIPGYEEVSDDFVENVRRLISLLNSGKKPAFLAGRLPSMFKEHMGRWIKSRGGFNPMLPLPADLPESALQQVVNVASNFTTYSWESRAALRNQSMVLFGKVARALLDNNRDQVLDKFTAAAIELHGLIASGDLAEISGMPGKKPTDNDICRRLVEAAVKEDAGGMDTPMVVMRDGDVHSVRPSPLTGEMIWKKVVACQCSQHDNPWRQH